ncbi:MAG TPA: hypothetical protein VGI60_00195 [Chthoniobacterales bacterium]|jgi:hypothetical protein
MTEEHPQGSVVGLCSAAATCFAVCSAFLGFWGFQGWGSWRAIDSLVLLPLAIGSLVLAITPYVATRPRANAVAAARMFFLIGVVLVWLALCIATILSVTGLGGIPKI